MKRSQGSVILRSLWDATFCLRYVSKDECCIVRAHLNFSFFPGSKQQAKTFSFKRNCLFSVIRHEGLSDSSPVYWEDA